MAHGGDRSLFGVSLRAATGIKFDDIAQRCGEFVLQFGNFKFDCRKYGLKFVFVKSNKFNAFCRQI
jgi:hypothetical protein